MGLLVDIFGYLTVVLRGLTLAAQSGTIGGIAFLALVARPFAASLGAPGALIERRCRVFLAWSALAFALAAALTILLEAAVLMGSLDLSLADTLGAGFARANLVIIAAALLIALLCRARLSRQTTIALVALGVIALTAQVATGHAAARLDGRVALGLADFLHMLGAGVWIGGIPYFIVALNRTDNATAHEIVERLTPQMPRFASPDHASLAISQLEARIAASEQTAGAKVPQAYVPGEGLVPPRNAMDIAWSEYNHHWSGIFVLAIGLLALLERTGRAPWARHWPLLFIGLALFLLIRSDPEVWPLGDIGLMASLRDPEVVQHRVFVVIIAAFGIFEWCVRTGRIRRPGAALIFPLLTAAGGMLLLTHSHALSNIKEQLLIEITHVPLALAGMTASASGTCVISIRSCSLMLDSACEWVSSSMPPAAVSSGKISAAPGRRMRPVRTHHSKMPKAAMMTTKTRCCTTSGSRRLAMRPISPSGHTSGSERIRRNSASPMKSSGQCLAHGARPVRSRSASSPIASTKMPDQW